MSVEIKVASIEPIRHTFDRVSRRFGSNKPASRYQEASFDLQPRDNFHYRPIWDPEHEIYDERRTKVKMADWDELKDPRQYYYASYVMNRARLQETIESNFAFIEKHDLLSQLSHEEIAAIESSLLPLRHVEWAANLNNCFITAYGFGTPITQGAMFNTTDRLGMAQYLSKIGLLLDRNSGSSLARAKDIWLTNKSWQPLRKSIESMLVQKDWFELFIAQNLIQDAILYPVMYGQYQNNLSNSGNSSLAMLLEFQHAWYPDNSKWVDACIKKVASESMSNTELLASWSKKWIDQVVEAVNPLLSISHEDLARARLDIALSELNNRLTKLGISN